MLQSANFSESMYDFRQPDLTKELSTFYDALGADEYICSIRRPAFGEGELNIADTCAVAGVLLKFANLKTCTGLYGYTEVVTGHYVGRENTYTSKLAVLVEEELALEQQRIVAGHELGHHFLRHIVRLDEQAWRQLSSQGEEYFCEYFAHEIVQDRITPMIGQLVLFGDSCEDV